MTKINNTKDRLLFNALINSSDSNNDNLIYLDAAGVRHTLPLNKRSVQLTNFFKAINATQKAYPRGLINKMNNYNKVASRTFTSDVTTDENQIRELYSDLGPYAKDAIEISPAAVNYISSPVTQKQADETLEAITKVLKGDQPERKKQLTKEVKGIIGPYKTEKSDPPQPEVLPNPELGRVIDNKKEEIKPETSPIQVERKEVIAKPETVQTYLEDTYQTSKEGETGGFRDPEKELKIVNELYVQQRALEDIRTDEEIIAAGNITPDELRSDLTEIDLSRTGQNTELDIATIPLPVQTELLVKEQNLGNLPKKLEDQFMELPPTIDKHKSLKEKLNRVFAATEPDATEFNKQNYKNSVSRIIDKLYDLNPIRNNGMTDNEVFDYVTSHLFNRIYEHGPDADRKMIEARNDFIEELRYYYGEDVYQDIENDMNYFQGAVTLQDYFPLTEVTESTDIVPVITDQTMVSGGGMNMGPNPPDDINTNTLNTQDNQVSNNINQLTGPEANKYGTSATFHKIPIKLVFNSSENPEWDPVLESTINDTDISNQDAFDIMGPLIDLQGSKIMVNSIKTSMKSTNKDVKKELNEILQLWYSFNRNMSKGPRVPKAGISLGSLLGSGVPTNTAPKVETSATNGVKVEPIVTDKVVANAWKNSHYQYGFNNSGPKDFLPRPRMTEPKNPLKPGTAEVPDKPYAKLKFKIDLNRC